VHCLTLLFASVSLLGFDYFVYRSDDATTDKGAWFGTQGWVAPLNYEFNNHGKFYELRQDDTLELIVDMASSQEGELSFIVNSRKMPNSIRGIRKALTEGGAQINMKGEACEEQSRDDAITEWVGNETVAEDGEDRPTQEAEMESYVVAVQMHSKGDVVRLYMPPREETEAGEAHTGKYGLCWCLVASKHSLLPS
jgi:hypothetical protein